MFRPWLRTRNSVIAAPPGRLLLGAVFAASSLGGCGNAPLTSVNHGGDTNGVSATSIRVGALASTSGFADADFAPVVTGARIYFDQLNANGGINGRKIDYSSTIDDGTSPNGDSSGAQKLVQDKVFAVVGIGTPFFTGSSVLRAHAVPTFGLQEDTNAQWGGPTMFGAGGSFVDFSSPMPQVADVAERNHDHRAAVLAYNIAQSSQGCVSVTAALHQYHIATPVVDTSVAYGAATLDADVTRMQRQGIDFVASCMDSTGNIKLSQTLQQHGMSRVTQYWLDGYDQQVLRNNAAAMEGAYFLLQQTPFEATSLDRGRYPGIDAFNAALKKYAPPGTLASTPALSGWVSADLFATGLKELGRTVTRSGLVSAINKLTSYTAGGAIPPVDWTIAHSATDALDCTTFVQVRHGEFVPVYGTSPSFYTCYGHHPTPSGSVTRLPLQPGVPGQ
jgi:ABC-type branched-subunit amino acid transport system substrate-binding protein